MVYLVVSHRIDCLSMALLRCSLMRVCATWIVAVRARAARRLIPGMGWTRTATEHCMPAAVQWNGASSWQMEMLKDGDGVDEAPCRVNAA